MSAPNLTEPQRLLLAEIRQSSTGGMWVRPGGRYHRTAMALVRKGLATTDWRKDWFEPVKP